MSEEDLQGLVFDCGSSSCLAGYAGDDHPSIIVPTVCGEMNGSMKAQRRRTWVNYFAGQEVFDTQDVTNCFPIERGVVQNWDQMEALWFHLYNELQVPPEEHCIMLSEPPLNPPSCHEKTTQIMFETCESNTGLVIDSGSNVTRVVPIIEGVPDNKNTILCSYGGDDITSYLGELVQKNNNDIAGLPVDIQSEVLKDIKELCSRVRVDNEAKSNREVKYKLPDGKLISVGDDASQCCELLFNPALNNIECQGIHELVNTSIQKFEKNLGAQLRANIAFQGIYRD
eukprot:CAMPEP_0206209712 /NCGR_PEP_ID=MMETSP0166-20121206/17070_1 /ASSEMBLY_ACC=CAM_ASM_000260 /TAXON_ID=95228 /ORGANISM="Vannella robusta, Strain DIVA3 518/3/11/1/6" /LENGTH=283 /DNA_ID=CAMNT_0053631157 /DNA_START=77 /DNA_END=929 /DNA_ORIENTATION=-